MADTCLGHYSSYIRKVEVDKSRDSYEIGDARDTELQNLICHIECFFERCIVINNFEELIIRDYNESIYILLKFTDALLGIGSSSCALESERSCNYCNCKDAEFLSDLSNNRSGSCTCAAAHAGCYEQHVGIRYSFGDLILGLFCRSLTDTGIGSAAETSCNFLAYLNLYRGLGPGKCLIITVDRDKIYSLNSAVDHSVYSVTAATAATYNLNRGEMVLVQNKSSLIRHRQILRVSVFIY